MPESAVGAGVVDVCAPVPALAAELLRLARHPYVVSAGPPASSHAEATMQKIFALIRESTRVDFSEYKRPTLERRIARRMALQKVESLSAYLDILLESPGEVRALHEEALIHVTSFFRDAPLFESLASSVFAPLMKDKADESGIRVWVPGCATGEEVYSLAICLTEFLGGSGRPVQLFGSDVSAPAIDTARAGIYPDAALEDVSEERRRRYFTKTERGYRIAKSLRDQCVFVQHDLARDAPFSKVDIVSCRNVLIYFDQHLQKRVVSTLHYALNQPGFLLLGRAESVSGFSSRFDVVDKTNKVFTRNAGPSALRFAPLLDSQPADPGVSTRPRARPGAPLDLSRRLDQLLLGRYAPPGVVVNQKMEVVQFRGQTGAFLQAAPGDPQSDLMQMARGGLAVTLRAAMAEVIKDSVPVRLPAVDVGDDGRSTRCDVVVIPLLGSPDAGAPLYVILFEAPVDARTGAAQVSPEAARGKDARRLAHELAATKEYLQTVIVEHGRVNEDLGVANLELVSSNEELQSMNEELETAKEELQSINEELTTVNDELQVRNQEATQMNSDLVNVLTAVDIPILILDTDRKIRRFTPKARRILNVVASDVGRALGDIKQNIDVPDLDAQIVEVIRTTTVRESEVQDRDGRWFRLQIRPYRTTDNRIDGAVLSLFDIDALKDNVRVAQLASSDSVRANHTKDEFLATLSHELRTPLSSMLMRAQLLRRGGMDDAKVRRAGESIEAGVKRQVQLIDDLLDVSRIVTGKLKMDMQPVDLARVVLAVVEGTSLAVERKSIKLDVEIAKDGPSRTVFGDDARLQQVVTNLLVNAIKFTPEHGTVTVSLVIGDETAAIRVKDTGMGIDADFLGSVFNRLAQDGSTSTRAYGGLGLGLAIVRHLVELHHGTVVAESPGRGLGATFSVSLPLMSLRAAPHAAPSTASLGHGPADIGRLQGLRILVMEDDRATREALADMLGRTGAVVQVASSSAEAIAAVAEFRPELLLCDIAMPGEDGYAFIRKLRALGVAQSGTVPALALTALAHAEDRERALAAGFQMHIAKPVDSDRLVESILKTVADRPPVGAVPASQPS